VGGDLLNAGLELFARGDLEGAARKWLEAKEHGAADPQIEDYLYHVASVAPAIIEKINAEKGVGQSPQAVELTAPTLEPIAPTLEPIAPGMSSVSFPTPIELPLAPQAQAPLMPSAAIDPPTVVQVHSSSLVPSIPTVRTDSPIALPGVTERSPTLAQAAVLQAPIAVPPSPSAVPRSPDDGPWGGATALGPAIEVAQSSGGLDLVLVPTSERSQTSLPPAEIVQGENRLKEFLNLDDFTGALAVADELLQRDSGHELALVARARCRDVLKGMYESKIGDLLGVPRVLVPPEQVIWLDLDHRSGFILAQVDGVSTYDELMELSGMDRLEALRIISQLVQKGVIGKG